MAGDDQGGDHDGPVEDAPGGDGEGPTGEDTGNEGDGPAGEDPGNEGDGPAGEDGEDPTGRDPVSDPHERRRRMVSAIAAARREGAAVAFDADLDGADDPTRIVFEDRTLRLSVEGDERERLDDLLEDYRAIKVAQPETRKAAGDTVVLSAVTDAKHAADFVEALFGTVYAAGESYELRARRPDQ